MTSRGTPFAVGLILMGLCAWEALSHDHVASPAIWVTPEIVPCPPGVDPKASQTLGATEWVRPVPGSCHTRMSPTGYPLPDPLCTPGAINPTVTAEVLKDPIFDTRCLRNVATSEQQKHIVYQWYGIHPPANNRGGNQACELDHAVCLGCGGADTLQNIWPQCGPDDVPLNRRYFKYKDYGVELPAFHEIKKGTADLPSLQRQMAEDWSALLTQGMSR